MQKKGEFPMVTVFGKFLRNLRMDIGELLLQMAKKLNVSPTFLSGVENGKRKIPSDWVNRISEIYHLDEAEKAHLQEAFYDTNNSIEIGLEKLQNPRRNLIFPLRENLTPSRMTKRNKSVGF